MWRGTFTEPVLAHDCQFKRTLLVRDSQALVTWLFRQVTTCVDYENLWPMKNGAILMFAVKGEN